MRPAAPPINSAKSESGPAPPPRIRLRMGRSSGPAHAPPVCTPGTWRTPPRERCRQVRMSLPIGPATPGGPPRRRPSAERGGHHVRAGRGAEGGSSWRRRMCRPIRPMRRRLGRARFRPWSRDRPIATIGRPDRTHEPSHQAQPTPRGSPPARAASQIPKPLGLAKSAGGSLAEPTPGRRDRDRRRSLLRLGPLGEPPTWFRSWTARRDARAGPERLLSTRPAVAVSGAEIRGDPLAPQEYSPRPTRRLG